MSSSALLLAAALASSSTSSSSSAPASSAGEWVQGPEAPASQAPLPPAVAPRDGEPGRPAPQETLVVPPVPPEDTRVALDDGLVPPLPDLRLQTGLDRRALTSSAFLDVDSFLAGAGVMGVVWLPSSAGAARPVARGHHPGQVGVVVDGVPLIGQAFGVDVAPSEVLSLVGVASLSFSHGPRSFSPVASSQAGLLSVDTGGSLTALGETGRADGLLAAGVGGADVESGATTVVRTGWRTLRGVAHGTALHRQDQRPGRSTPGDPSSSSTAILPGTGGAGGTIGARVDVAPLPQSRVFVSYLGGRGLDVADPLSCGVVDDEGRAVDCVRARERGADVGVVGVDVVRAVAGLTLQPMARLHLQRALSVDERSGRLRPSVDLARDEVVRGGAILGLSARATSPLAFDLVPSLDVALDARADRATSSFSSRSTLRRNAAPPGDGLSDPARARAIDGAVAREGLVRVQARLDGEHVAVAVASRFQALQVQAPAVVTATLERDAVDAVSFAPSVDASARLRLTSAWSVFTAVGSVDRGEDPAALVAGAGHGSGVVAAPPGSTRGAERFAELGVSLSSAAVDVDAVAFGSLRAPTVQASDGVLGAGPDEGAAGLEARFTLKPDLDGVRVSGSLAGVVVDSDVFGDGRDARAGVIQPQGQVQLRYEPSAWPVGLYARAWGAFPQPRLSAGEQQDPQRCPERPTEENIPQDRPCSGLPAFAAVDAGAFVRLGQLRFDLAGENVLDHRNRWQGGVVGVGGAAVRLRVAFLF